MSTLTREDAAILLEALDAGTDGNWPNVRDRLEQMGHTPAEVIRAWKKLESLAGMCGMVPDPCDF